MNLFWKEYGTPAQRWKLFEGTTLDPKPRYLGRVVKQRAAKPYKAYVGVHEGELSTLEAAQGYVRLAAEP